MYFTYLCAFSLSFSFASLVLSSPRPFSDTALAVLVKGLPEMLLRQFEYEDAIVRGGKHLLHSPFFKELAALACDLNLDSLSTCAGRFKWAWFRRYCMAARVAEALVNRQIIPQVEKVDMHIDEG